MQEIKEIFSRDAVLSKYVEGDLVFHKPTELGSIEDFECDVKDLKTQLVLLNSGYFLQNNIISEKLIVKSFKDARESEKEIFNKYFDKIDAAEITVDVNRRFTEDGVFIRIPDNTNLDVPIQIVNYIHGRRSQFVQTRFLIIVGKNSSATFIQCNDSSNKEKNIANELSEIYLADGATVNYIRMQNLNNNSAVISNMFINQAANANFNSVSFNLNAGLIRTSQHVKMHGQHAVANVSGLYLVDKQQRVENNVKVNHAVPNCYSHELFKGIVDDAASAFFNGHVIVQKGADKTEAYQSNKNILLSDKAKVTTEPNLEIYADDVKCSHGATIGQLDETAMFYMRARGLSYNSARMLLLYAFADEVIQKINIPAMADYVEDIVKKRLRGELTSCDHCVLRCHNPEQHDNWA